MNMRAEMATAIVNAAGFQVYERVATIEARVFDAVEELGEKQCA